MIYVRRFLDKMSVVDSKRSKDIVIPIDEARGLRDEIAKLLSELYEREKNKPEPILEVQIKGGSFK